MSYKFCEKKTAGRIWVLVHNLGIALMDDPYWGQYEYLLNTMGENCEAGWNAAKLLCSKHEKLLAELKKELTNAESEGPN